LKLKLEYSDKASKKVLEVSRAWLCLLRPKSPPLSEGWGWVGGICVCVRACVQVCMRAWLRELIGKIGSCSNVETRLYALATQAAIKENELMKKKREEFETAVVSFDSKSKFIAELRMRQKEQLEYRGQQLQEKISGIMVGDRLRGPRGLQRWLRGVHRRGVCAPPPNTVCAPNGPVTLCVQPAAGVFSAGGGWPGPCWLRSVCANHARPVLVAAAWRRCGAVWLAGPAVGDAGAVAGGHSEEGGGAGAKNEANAVPRRRQVWRVDPPLKCVLGLCAAEHARAKASRCWRVPPPQMCAWAVCS
jgi:hypothetical protein